MVSRHFGLTDYPRARVRPQGSAPPQQGNRGSPPVLLRLNSGWSPPFACFRGSGGLTSGAASYGESGTRTERRVAPLVGVMRYPEFRRAASNRWPDVRGACTPPRVVSRMRSIAVQLLLHSAIIAQCNYCTAVQLLQYCMQYCSFD